MHTIVFIYPFYSVDSPLLQRWCFADRCSRRTHSLRWSAAVNDWPTSTTWCLSGRTDYARCQLIRVWKMILTPFTPSNTVSTSLDDLVCGSQTHFDKCAWWGNLVMEITPKNLPHYCCWLLNPCVLWILSHYCLKISILGCTWANNALCSTRKA